VREPLEAESMFGVDATAGLHVSSYHEPALFLAFRVATATADEEGIKANNPLRLEYSSGTSTAS